MDKTYSSIYSYPDSLQDTTMDPLKANEEPLSISFSLLHFFDLYVRPCNTSLYSHQYPMDATQIPPSQLKKYVVQYLNKVRIGPKDIKLATGVDGKGCVDVSARGLRVLDNFLDMKVRSHAAMVIQTHWKKYVARKSFRKTMAEKSNRIENRAPVQAKEPAAKTQAVPAPIDKAVLRRHLHKISTTYFNILKLADKKKAEKSQQRISTIESTTEEVEFMKLLNSELTFKLHTLLTLYDSHHPSNYIFKPATSQVASSSLDTYLQYSPKLIQWICKTLDLKGVPDQVFLPYLLSSGDVFCQLATTLFPKIKCHLMSKGPEFAVHKIIFFLELCKTVGIKTNMLFQLDDLVQDEPLETNRRDSDSRKIKSSLTILRTIYAFEKQARKKSWKGPPLVLNESKQDKGKERKKKNLMVAKPERDSIMSSYSNNDSIYGFYAHQQAPEGKERMSVASMPTRVDVANLPGRAGHHSPRRESYLPRLEVSQSPGFSSVLDIIDGKQNSKEQTHDMPSLDNKEALASEPVKEHMRRSVSSKPSRQNEGMSERMKLMMKKKQELGMNGNKWKIKVIQSHQKRRDVMMDFIQSEETHIQHIRSMLDFMEQVIKKRRRISKRASRSLAVAPFQTQSHINTSVDPDVLQWPSNDSLELTQTDITQVEIENEGLERVHQIVETIVSIHEDLVRDIQEAIEHARINAEHVSPVDDSEKPILSIPTGEEIALLGDALLRFSDAIVRPYIQYSVLALQGQYGEDEEEEEDDEPNVSRVLIHIIQEWLHRQGSDSDTPPSLDDARVFLSQLVKRIHTYYTTLLGLAQTSHEAAKAALEGMEEIHRSCLNMDISDFTLFQDLMNKEGNMTHMAAIKLSVFRETVNE